MITGIVAVIGLDLAKNVFQLHGIEADGRVLVAARYVVISY